MADKEKRALTGILLRIARGETKGAVFVLETGSNQIGRWDPDAGAFPEVDLDAHDPEAKVSRRHARIEWDGADSLVLEDAGSLNGSFVNRGARLKAGDKVTLKIGDELIFGKTFLVVEKAGS